MGRSGSRSGCDCRGGGRPERKNQWWGGGESRWRGHSWKFLENEAVFISFHLCLVGIIWLVGHLGLRSQH